MLLDEFESMNECESISEQGHLLDLFESECDGFFPAFCKSLS